MAQINKATDYFQTKLYTGDDTNNRQISLDFSPDWTWLKARSAAYGHIVYDRVRGVGNRLTTSGTNAESDGTDLSWTNSGCTTNSFTVDRGTNESQNETGTTYVAWNWLAGGTASSNTDGSITSQVSASTTSGFSIVSYTGTGANATVGHGLGVAPKMIITKVRSASGNNWSTYHSSLGAGNVIWLNLTNGSTSDSTFWNNTTPTSSVFSIGTQGDTNRSSETMIAYCFAEKKGFSKAFSYTGNGSTDGSFLFCGFRPAFFMAKRTDTASQWILYDNKRQNNYNPQNERLYPNLSDAAGTGREIDFVSNGIKLRDNATDSSASNVSGGTYIGLAFAEFPLVSSAGVPTCAR